MAAVVIEIEGLDALTRKANDTGALIGKPLRQFFTRGAIAVEKESKLLAPVDEGRLRGSINYEVDGGAVPEWAKIGPNVAYGCVIGSRHPVYEPMTRTVGHIGKYPYEHVLAKDGQPHEIEARLRYPGFSGMEGIAIRIRPKRRPLVLTPEHLVLVVHDGVLQWRPAGDVTCEDRVFSKRAHNAVTDGSNMVTTTCPCGREFQQERCVLKQRQPKYCSLECRHRYGSHAQNTGKHWHQTEAQREARKGAGNPAWRDGANSKPYDWRFNDRLKATIRARDGNQCVACGDIRRLVVHHRDWNKANSEATNLVTLCRPCHARMTYGREDCELPSVNLTAFTPRPPLSIERITYRQDARGYGKLPALYDFTVANENSFVVGGMLVHNSSVEYGIGEFNEGPGGMGQAPLPTVAQLEGWAHRHGVSAQWVYERIQERGGIRPNPYMRTGFANAIEAITGYLEQCGRDIAAVWNA